QFPASIFIAFPIIIWGACRFSQGVSSATVLAVALFSIWNFTRQTITPTANLSTPNVLDLQIGLILMSATSLILSASAEEEKRLDKPLGENEHFIEQITNTMPGILYVYDFTERRVIYLNP